MDSQEIRVLIVDDHTLFCDALARSFVGEPGITVVGKAQDGFRAIERARQLTPDVTLMDARMPRLNGIDATHRILQEFPHCKIVGCSYDGAIQEAMLRAGAVAFVSKTESLAHLLQTLREVGRRLGPAKVS